MPVFKSNSWGWNGKKDPLTTREQYKRVDGASWYKPALMKAVDTAFADAPYGIDIGEMREQARKTITEKEFVPEVKKQLDAYTLGHSVTC